MTEPYSIAVLRAEPISATDRGCDHDRNNDCENDTDIHFQHLLLIQDNAR